MIFVFLFFVFGFLGDELSSYSSLSKHWLERRAAGATSQEEKGRRRTFLRSW